MYVHIENQLGFVGYDISIVGYGMVCQYGVMLGCYVMVCYCMLVWYDVSVIG